jgi:hypothetical protein
MDFNTVRKRIFSILSQNDFDELALSVFHLQYEHNSLYHSFVDSLGLDLNALDHPVKIPFLPVSFFKSHRVYCARHSEETIFESSTTTGSIPSRHYVAELALYRESFRKGFKRTYGKTEDYVIIGLLPSYLERKHSSLVYMVADLVAQSKHVASGFYLYDHSALAHQLDVISQKGLKVILIGVGYALLDFIENHPMKLPGAIIVETGGMKGRRQELIREELHYRLCQGFGVQCIHSEYGMTELLSQAWSKGDGHFSCPPWMNVMIRDANDPLSPALPGLTGGINIIDLANLYSCSFIATDDLGRMQSNGTFEVLGRFDAADVRGCSLMVS